MLERLQKQHVETLKSDRVLKNDGKAFDRTNFVKINQNKMAKYKPAMRGAAFTAKIMAKKSNANNFKRR